eukprot:4294289-Amphidinium_carterae.1
MCIRDRFRGSQHYDDTTGCTGSQGGIAARLAGKSTKRASSDDIRPQTPTTPSLGVQFAFWGRRSILQPVLCIMPSFAVARISWTRTALMGPTV